MKYIVLLFLLLQTLLLSAQFKKIYFQITPKVKPIANGLYNEMEVADLRKDSSDLGLVEGWGPPSVIIPRLPLQVQLNNVLKSHTHASTHPGKLLLMLRNFHFVKPSDKRFLSFVYLYADVFESTPDGYRYLRTFNKGISFNRSASIEKMLNKGAELLSSVVDSVITTPAENTRTLTFYEATQIDSIQKSHIKLYNSKRYIDGVYKNWQEFAAQQPQEKNFIINRNLNKISGVSVTTAEGKELTLPLRDYFAVVENGVPYAACEYGVFPMKKVNGDFYFTAIHKQFNGKAYMNHGVLGGMASGPDVQETRYVLVHSAGMFIRSMDNVNMNSAQNFQ